MNLATVQFPSAALGRQVTYTALLPEAGFGPGPFPALYQLHGASDDHTGWTRFSNLVRHAAKLPLIVVMPDGGLGWWLNRGPRERYEDFVIEDLSAHVAATFHVRPGRHAIGGLSMGGFGAVYLGLRHPDRFCSIWSHSGAFRSSERLRDLGWPEDEARAADIDTVVRAVESGGMPVLAFDCGVDDVLLDANRRLDALLSQLGLPHLYREHPGGHTWDYWDAHVPEALEQHARVLAVDARVPRGGPGPA